MSSLDRRYDIDWLRVIAIGLLLIYHIAIGFQPWGLLIGFIQNEQSLQSLWIPMSMLNIWRIPLLFFVSGMGVYFALRKRNWKQLLWERTGRILLPFVFGIFAIVPIHVVIIQDYYNLKASYLPSAGHLWFLGNIFIYVLLLLPILFYLKKNEERPIGYTVKRLFGSLWGLILMIGCFIIEVLLVKPVSFELYAETWHGFFLGLLAFIFGFLFVYSGNAFWQMILKWRWLFLGIGLVLYLLRVFQLHSLGYIVVIESNIWIFAAFGFAYKYLNHPSKTLTYLSRGAYPIYIIHMFVLYFASWLVFPSSLPVSLQFIIVVCITTFGCIILYEFGIRRISFLRPLFGLKGKTDSQMLITKGEKVGL